MTDCNRRGCSGRVTVTGFCDQCGLRALAVGRPTAVPTTGPITLPRFAGPAPEDRVLVDPVFPEQSRFCGNPDCRTWDGDRWRLTEVGRRYRDQPALDEGYCDQCETWFSFRLKLARGDLVDGRYRVVGPIAHGGQGWIYLARDERLEGSLVVLKGLINSTDTRAVELAVNERRSLQRLDHHGIVRINDAVTWTTRRVDFTGNVHVDAIGFIVMPYVDGLSLRDVIRTVDQMPLGTPILVEHVVLCGLEILAALDYLHDNGLLYCDMKPDNVMLTYGADRAGGSTGNRIKLVDLGGVRAIGDLDSPIVTTYGPPDPKEPPSIQFDIYTVGRTLHEFARATDDYVTAGTTDSGSVALASLRLLIGRAMHSDPAHRFGGAVGMADQLRGARWEMESLRTGLPHRAESTAFEATVTVLDAGLGSVPGLDRWTAAGARAALRYTDPLGSGRPTPAMVAAGLPAPLVDPADRGAALLAEASALSPRRLLDKLDDYRAQIGASAAIEWRALSAWLALGDVERAGTCLRDAGRALGAAGAHDWRAAWYRGLYALADDRVADAESEFRLVRTAVPGEIAPKLALGHCAEQLSWLEPAERFFEAVWRRDRAQVDAAFGLARIRMAQLDRDGAVRVLDEVPEVSRHYDAAQIAAVRVCCGRLDGPGGSDRPDFTTVDDRLDMPYLDDQARSRLKATIQESALYWITIQSLDTPVSVLGVPTDERAVRLTLEQLFRDLARQARTTDQHGVLIDLANAIRPRTWW